MDFCVKTSRFGHSHQQSDQNWGLVPLWGSLFAIVWSARRAASGRKKRLFALLGTAAIAKQQRLTQLGDKKKDTKYTLAVKSLDK